MHGQQNIKITIKLHEDQYPFVTISRLYKIYNIVQSKTTISNILFIGLGRHVSIPLWYNIQGSICENLNQEMEKEYKLLDNKVSNLVSIQTVTSNNKLEFYPRVINKTNIVLTDEEVTPLNKGCEYNLTLYMLTWKIC